MGADIVYTDVWASMSQKEEADQRILLSCPEAADRDKTKPGAVTVKKR